MTVDIYQVSTTSCQQHQNTNSSPSFLSPNFLWYSTGKTKAGRSSSIKKYHEAYGNLSSCSWYRSAVILFILGGRSQIICVCSHVHDIRFAIVSMLPTHVLSVEITVMINLSIHADRFSHCILTSKHLFTSPLASRETNSNSWISLWR